MLFFLTCLYGYKPAPKAHGFLEPGTCKIPRGKVQGETSTTQTHQSSDFPMWRKQQQKTCCNSAFADISKNQISPSPPLPAATPNTSGSRKSRGKPPDMLYEYFSKVICHFKFGTHSINEPRWKNTCMISKNIDVCVVFCNISCYVTSTSFFNCLYQHGAFFSKCFPGQVRPSLWRKTVYEELQGVVEVKQQEHHTCISWGHRWVISWPSVCQGFHMGVSENGGTPKSSHFNRVFHYKPSILGYPYFWKHPYIII